jgi:hypothetical protein
MTIFLIFLIFLLLNFAANGETSFESIVKTFDKVVVNSNKIVKRDAEVGEQFTMLVKLLDTHTKKFIARSVNFPMMINVLGASCKEGIVKANEGIYHMIALSMQLERFWSHANQQKLKNIPSIDEYTALSEDMRHEHYRLCRATISSAVNLGRIRRTAETFLETVNSILESNKGNFPLPLMEQYENSKAVVDPILKPLEESVFLSNEQYFECLDLEKQFSISVIHNINR